MNVALVSADSGFQTYSQELEELSDNVRNSFELIELFLCELWGWFDQDIGIQTNDIEGGENRAGGGGN